MTASLQQFIDNNVGWLSWLYAIWLFAAPVAIASTWVMLAKGRNIIAGKRAFVFTSASLLTVSLAAAVSPILVPLLVPPSIWKLMAPLTVAGLYGLVGSRPLLKVFIVYSVVVLTVFWLSFGYS
jgi:hypothetical protein